MTVALKQQFGTATMEILAMRMLDLDESCVISIVDDGIVSVRRGNRSPAGKRLESAEQACHDRVAELELPHRVRAEGWTVWGWPVPGALSAGLSSAQCPTTYNIRAF